MPVIISYRTGPAEAGVQDVPGHTQYLPPYLIKPKLQTEKNDLCTNGHTQSLAASAGPDEYCRSNSSCNFLGLRKIFPIVIALKL